MNNMPFYVEPLSFGIGFFIGVLFWILLGRLRPAFKEWREGLSARREESQSHRSSGVEENHRRITLRRAQGMHLASPLFALDEILQSPVLIAPPARLEPGKSSLVEDIVSMTLPYMPAWPELATIYGAPRLSIPQALSGGGNIVLIGLDGMGKTVTLAHLASLVANRAPQLGELGNIVPFLIHAADLSLPVSEPKNILNPIIDIASEQVSFMDLGRVSNFVQHCFKNGRALLLLDGYDELAQDDQKAITEFLKTLIEAHPHTRMVATALPEQIGGLLNLGFSPLALLGWDARGQKEFIRKWGEQWERFITTEAWTQAAHESIDTILLDAWLVFGNQHLTPLELTLKVWGGYAGDSHGPRVMDAISTHIRRLAPANTPIAALEMLAMQVILNAQPVFDPRKARAWIKSFEPAEDDPNEEQMTDETKSSLTSPRSRKKGAATLQVPSSGLIAKMSSSGILLTHTNNRMRFLHPVLGGYLAGRALSTYKAGEELLSQPNWSGKLLAMRYLAAHGDATRLVDSVLTIEDPLLERPLLNAARWLREAPREAAWRGRIMAGLVQILQDEGRPRGLRGQAMAALVLCGDPGAAILFRQSLQSMSFELIPLAALGCGAIRDGKALELLSSTMSAPSSSARRAVCLALVAIGSPAALEAVAHALLSGDDDLRRAAGEALANDSNEGYAMLRDGATLKDILVRRAVVYGLARVNEPWAQETLQRMQVEDDQWIVRTAATEVLDSQASSIDAHPPLPLPPPSETPWLIEFAGKYGVGISPGIPATDLLIKALKDGSTEERLGALNHLRQTPTEGVIKSIYEAVYSNDSELREAAYQTIWELGSSGIPLPNPAQFGFV